MFLFKTNLYQWLETEVNTVVLSYGNETGGQFTDAHLARLAGVMHMPLLLKLQDFGHTQKEYL